MKKVLAQSSRILLAIVSVVFGIVICAAGFWVPGFVSDLYGIQGGVTTPKIGNQDRGVVIDSTPKTVVLMVGDVDVGNMSIQNLASSNSPWYPSSGTFGVLDKEERHISPISKTIYPWSVSLGGNIFVHGPPAGSIQLSLSDAREFYNFVSIGTPVSITIGGDDENRNNQARESKISNDNIKEKAITARSYTAIDIISGEIIASRDPDMVLPIASITKLFTAAVYSGDDIQNGNIDERLYPLLLMSSNRVAEQFAQEFGKAQFIEQMNAFAKSINLKKTSFADASGLSPKNVSTARELALSIAYLASTTPKLLDITQEKKHGDARYVGGKNGYTPEARQTSLSIYSFPLDEFSSKSVAIALLGSSDRNGDLSIILSKISAELYRKGGKGELMMFAPQKVTSPQPSDGPRTLLFVGDIMLDRGVRGAVENKFDGNYNTLFEYAYFTRLADLTFGNLEGPVSDRGYDIGNVYPFRSDPKAISALSESGFDVISVANNHAGDYGRSALEDTLTRLNSAGIVAVGGSSEKEDISEPHLFVVKGKKIGYLAFSDVGPEWLSEKKGLPAIALVEDSADEKAISEAAKKVDVLVVSYHFGNEYESAPSARQVQLARRAVDLGAKIVVGHHPHVRQPLEKYKDGIIAYSLGNFIFDQTFSNETTTGTALVVELGANGSIAGTREYEVKSNEFMQPVLVDDFEY